MGEEVIVVPEPIEDRVLNALDLSPEAAAVRRARLEAELRRQGAQPFTPELLAEVNAAHPPPTGGELEAYLEAIARRREC